MNFFTLLYIDWEGRALSQNGIEGDFHDQLSIFLRSCERLSRSLSRYVAESSFTVLTNDKGYFEGHGSALNVREIPFSTEVPRDIRFFSAHHKLDVFRWLAKNAGSYSILLDADVVCINPMPPNLRVCIDKAIPTYYDISEGVFPAYGREKIIRDKNLVGAFSSTGMWAGGEFLGGSGSFFRDLCERIDASSARYFNMFHDLHHQGDEMLTSVALEQLMEEGKYISDVGRFGAIIRYWSVETLHVQRDLSAFRDYFLLHLPADKAYLATYEAKSDFFPEYQEYVRKKNTPTKRSLVRRIGGRIKTLIKRT